MNKLICFMLFRQYILCPFAFAFASAGKSMPARMAMIAMTTSNSIRVKAANRFSDFFVRITWVPSYINSLNRCHPGFSPHRQSEKGEFMEGDLRRDRRAAEERERMIDH